MSSCPSCSPHPLAPLVGLPQGFVFGVLLQKSRMSAPENIKNQMALKDWTMMKTFLSASGTSAISFGLLQLFGLATLSPMDINWRGNLIGGALIGAGMTLGGACPGTMLAQLGEGVETAPYSLLGGLLGASVYGILINQSWAKSILSSTEVKGPHNTLHGLLGKPMWTIAIPMGIALVGIACGLEKIFPSPKRVENESNTECMKKRQWHPIWSGIALGSLQIPVNLFVKAYLGTSSAFVTASTFVTKYLPLNQSYFSKYIPNTPKNVWQLVNDLCMVGGAYVSAVLGNTRYKSTRALTTQDKVMALASGFLLLFGARTANGCTSGHGLSQMCQLSFAGFISVASMMICGIGLGVALDKLRK
ncbi:hypothetical protein FDP41_006537 [Naegleria fowleri]|uniref:Uncharacterized protein n=1 Tax=Naegleria fowleri TaxID=5763 RepID=A0A6A5BLR9_NAEFO|nr:uncharacterized protein FDP41_006537 [Naegleria fowleri]KAF0974505.1 hypothetical protein FDP41_006537 [Naegleria fowleri]CAG4719577.1 unnamed protein product [Naegleria fowleri]